MIPATLEIAVTQDDIARGEVKDCERCAVALAALRAGKAAGIPADTASADHCIIALGTRTPAGFEAVVRYATPLALSDWIERFDNFEHVPPIIFTCGRYSR